MAFLVRPRAAAACEAGTTLYPLVRRGEREPVTFKADSVFTSLEDVAKERWDQVWLCVPATALDEGWLLAIAGAVGEALVVALPPGLDSEPRIRRAFPGDRVVPGLIGIMSYQAPLPGEEVPRPGIAYFFPPGSPTAFGGPHAVAVAGALRAGGCPAVTKRDVATTSVFGSCVLMPVVAALEAAGWSFAELRRGPLLTLAAEASREAMGIASARLGVRAPLFGYLVRGWILGLVLALAPRLVPFELEAFLRHHFTKVGDQTRLLLGEYCRDGEARGLGTLALGSLANKLKALPA